MMRTRWLGLMILAAALAAPAAAGTVKTELNGLEIKIDSDSGGIVGLAYPGVGDMLKTEPERAGLLDLACPIPDFEPLRLATRFSTGAQIEKSPNGVVIRWDRLGASRQVDPGKPTQGVRIVFDKERNAYKEEPVPASAYDLHGPVAARVELRPDADGRSVLISCAIDNQSSYSLRQVMFPDLRGIVPFAGEADTLFRAGGMTVAPWEKLKHPDKGAPFYAWENAYGGAEYKGMAYFGTSMMIMRWMDVGGLRGGFSLFPKLWRWTDHNKSWESLITVRLQLSEIDNKLRLMVTEKAEIKPGARWESPVYVLTPHTGGWAKGIEPYRQFARANIKRVAPVPRRVREGLGFRTVYMTNSVPGDPAGDAVWKFSDFPALAREAKKHGLTELVPWFWHEHFSLPLPKAWSSLGGEEGLVKAAEECKKIGVNLTLFISINTMAKDSAERYGQKVDSTPGTGWTYHPELIPRFNPYYAGRWFTAGAPMADPNWQRDALASFKRLIDLGLTSFAWDVFTSSSEEPNVYGLTRQIRALARARDPESTFAGESASNIECEADLLDYMWSWGQYGDYRPYTSVFPAPRINPNIDRSARDAKLSFMDNLYMNVMPMKPEGVNGSARIEDYKELSRALEQCAALRRQFLPYFTDGTLIGECVLAKPVKDAQVTAYALGGKLLMIVLNNSGAEAAIQLPCDLAQWLPSASGKYQAAIFNENGRKIADQPIAAANWTADAGKLASLELKFYEISAR